jgi:hypothetical protein
MEFIKSQPNAEEKTKVKKMIKKAVVDSIINPEKEQIGEITSKISKYIELEKTKTKKFLFTYNSLEKGIIETFAHLDPIDEDLSSIDPDDDPRTIERNNIIKFLNSIVETIIEGKWNSSKGLKIISGDPSYAEHNKSILMTRQVAMQIWTGQLKKAIIKMCSITAKNLPENDASREYKRLLYDIDDKNLFLNKLPEQVWSNIRKMVSKISEHPIWNNPNPQLQTILSAKDLRKAENLIISCKTDDNEKPLYDEGVTDSFILAALQ